MPVALFAVGEVAGGNSSLQWQRLLRAGIAEELCGCFLRAPVYTNERGVSIFLGSLPSVSHFRHD